MNNRTMQSGNVFRVDPKSVYRELLSNAEQSLNIGHFLAAESSARKLQERFSQDAKANFVLAQVLVAKGEHKAAQVFAEIAHKLVPLHPGTNYFLGRIYLQLELYEKAVPLFQEGLKKLPQSALLNWGMADLCLALNKGEEAVSYYETALALPSEDNIKHEIIGAYALALTTIERHEDANIQLSLLKDLPRFRSLYISQKSFDPNTRDWPKLEEEISKALEIELITNDEKSVLLHALGNVYDRQKKPDDAFLNWQNARAFMGDQFAIDDYVATIENLKKFYSKDFIDKLSAFGQKSQKPVFIFGMARAGTTLVEQIISAHQYGYGVGELTRMVNLEQDFFNRYGDNPTTDSAMRNAKAGEIREYAKTYLSILENIAPNKSLRVVNKTVTQFQSAGFIHCCFPNAKFVHCNRHPAASFTSAFQNRLAHSYVSNQEHYAKYYLGKQKLVEHWQSCFPNSILEINYEDLVRNPEPVVRSLIAFLDLEWDPNCMRFFEQQSTVKTLSSRQVRQPIYTSSVYRWKKYEKHLGPLFAALDEANFTYPEI